ncbi:MAG: hypothetical protein ACOC44_06150 [Promethearchaeia archaeon]
MNQEDSISKEIGKLKTETKSVVKKLQNLKQKLSSGEIELTEFKQKKNSLEEKLRSILKKITEYKEQRTVQIEKEESRKEDKETEGAKGKKVQIPSQVDKEIQLAGEAKDLMHHFQTEFKESITKATIYLSITLDEHFEIQIDFGDYPEKPDFILPEEILQMYESKEDFLKQVPSYIDWDINDPLEIYKLVQEVETVLINKFNADLRSIEKKAKQQQNELKNKLEEMEQEVNELIKNNEITEAINLYYAMVDLAYDLQDHDRVSEYTDNIEKLKLQGGF